MTTPRHCLHVFSTFAAGGPQVRTVGLLNAFPAEFRHTIVALDGCEEARGRLRPGGPVQVVPAPGLHGGFTGLRQRRAFLDAQGPDLLLTYNWGAIEWLAAARLAGFRRVIHAEDGFGPEESRRQFARRVWARRLLLRGVAQVVVPSRNLERIARAVWWVPGSRLLHVDNGIDLEQFRPGPAQQERLALGVGEGELLVGTVTGLRAEKSLDHLLRAFAGVASAHRARLVLVGDGPERAGLEGLARALGVQEQVTFAGAVADPSGLLRAMDVFALSSRTEQMPLSVVEAMACARPVVATDVGDVADMVAAENRPFVVPPEDPAAYQEALGRLLSDGALRQTLGHANRVRAEERFAFSDMAERYLELYRRVSGGAVAR